MKVATLYIWLIVWSFVDSMPFLVAMTHEVLRLKSFVPVVDHATLCDSEVGGFYIPCGTAVHQRLLFSAPRIAYMHTVMRLWCLYSQFITY